MFSFIQPYCFWHWCTSLTLIAPTAFLHSLIIYYTHLHEVLPAYGSALLLTLMPKTTLTSHPQKSIIRVVKSVLYRTNNFPASLSGSGWASASCTLLMLNRYQRSPNCSGTFITSLKYLSFMEGNKDKWKSWLSRRYNGLIKADGHRKREF